MGGGLWERIGLFTRWTKSADRILGNGANTVLLTVPRSGDDGKCVGKSDSEREKERK